MPVDMAAEGQAGRGVQGDPAVCPISQAHIRSSQMRQATAALVAPAAVRVDSVQVAIVRVVLVLVAAVRVDSVQVPIVRVVLVLVAAVLVAPAVEVAAVRVDPQIHR
jgi:hypothetical protein